MRLFYIDAVWFLAMSLCLLPASMSTSTIAFRACSNSFLLFICSMVSNIARFNRTHSRFSYQWNSTTSANEFNDKVSTKLLNIFFFFFDTNECFELKCLEMLSYQIAADFCEVDGSKKKERETSDIRAVVCG